MNFFKRVLSTITGIIIFFGLCFVSLFILGFIFGASSDALVTVKPNSVLDLKLDFPIKDYAGKTEFAEYPFLNENRKDGLFNIIDAINYAATDDHIKGISIDNNFISAGISQTKALRDALLNFKYSGKFINAYADIYTQKDYYLSSIADTIYINPAGTLEFKGLSSERLYFKDFQEKTGLKMEVIRLGKYKSAVEPYLDNKMSADNRAQITVYLNSIWNEIKNEISQSRAVSTLQLNTIADSLLARNAKRAKATKLVDKIAYYDEYTKDLKTLVGIDSSKTLETIKIKDYANYVATKVRSGVHKNSIAVIYAEGEIIYGQGEIGRVGHISINKSLRDARADDKVKAIVLRINSPGGSALASELIWREIELTKKLKPVIVSMGDLAASGGYYIACNANKIFAQPTSITGSIGVFGMLPNAKGLADSWGINAEQVATNKNATTYSFLEPLSDQQRAFIQEGVSNIYELFTNRVAHGRAMKQDDVQEIAQGRVWTGLDALNNGLIDQLGGLDEALNYAATLVTIDAYSIKEFPVFEKDLDKMLEDYGLVKTKESILKAELGEANYKILKKLKTITQRKDIQLLFPFDFDIN